ncbi:MAG: alpha/beta hydrolase [Verrucomicrobia bacterium]|nr:alpha/beta hydrolase [Verrucomicrobiota bacterium]
MKTLRIFIALVLSAAFCFAAEPDAKSARPKGPPKFQAPAGVELIHDVEIGKGGDRVLHAEIARPEKPSATPMPAVLWIHGGGWSGGSHRGNGALWLATKGYFTASIEYRLSGEAKWPAQIEDCKLGVRWLRANAAKYNVDPNRIGCWGSSAGGHLVACLGTMDDARFEGSGGYKGISSRVQTVVDYCGPADFTAGSAGIQGAKEGDDAKAPLGLFGAPFKAKPEPWRDGSPIIHVKPGCPPFLIVHGDADKTVPFAQSEQLAAALKKAGVPVQLLRVKGGGHGMMAAKDAPPAKPNPQVIRDTVTAFFDKHLKK